MRISDCGVRIEETEKNKQHAFGLLIRNPKSAFRNWEAGDTDKTVLRNVSDIYTSTQSL